MARVSPLWRSRVRSGAGTGATALIHPAGACAYCSTAKGIYQAIQVCVGVNVKNLLDDFFRLGVTSQPFVNKGDLLHSGWYKCLLDS